MARLRAPPSGWTTALDALDRAYAQRDPNLVLLRTTAWFDPLREDSRYQQRVERLAFPPTGR